MTTLVKRMQCAVIAAGAYFASTFLSPGYAVENSKGILYCECLKKTTACRPGAVNTARPSHLHYWSQDFFFKKTSETERSNLLSACWRKRTVADRGANQCCGLPDSESDSRSFYRADILTTELAARRQALSDRAKSVLQNTKNHCQSFVDIVANAVLDARSVVEVLEDLKFILIGESLLKRGAGPFYVGNAPGARGDSGFKSTLKDNSPQVEHAFAAIYVGKYYPGGTEGLAVITEIVLPEAGGGRIGAADVLLYAIGGDIGQRLSGGNYKQLPEVIKKTMCE